MWLGWPDPVLAASRNRVFFSLRCEYTLAIISADVPVISATMAIGTPLARAHVIHTGLPGAVQVSSVTSGVLLEGTSHVDTKRKPRCRSWLISGSWRSALLAIQ